MKISYDWRSMPIEFLQESQPTGSSDNSLFRLTMAYDGSGRRISKTRWVKNSNSQEWEKELVTHYTGIGTEVRESFTGANADTKVVVNMPEGFGRYGVEDALKNDADVAAGEIPMMSFEWYVKNHLGSTMLVYGTQGDAIHYQADFSKPLAAYDYRAFGEMVELVQPRTGKVTENFTGKEHDEEIALSYFGARYLDPMLGMWTSVDPKRQFASPYLYAGNGMNPVNVIDPDGNVAYINIKNGKNVTATVLVSFQGDAASNKNIQRFKQEVTEKLNGQYGHYNLTVKIVDFNPKIHKAGMNNVINLTKSDNYGICVEAASCVTPDFKTAYIKWENGTHTRVHEFAHLLGLDDKYQKPYMDFSDNWGKPLKGYDNDNLMVKGLDLKESQIEEMWSPGPSDPANGYPANGYKYNEVTREE